MSWYDFDERYCEGCEKIDPTKVNEIEEEVVSEFRKYIREQFVKEFNYIKEAQEKIEAEKSILKEKQNDILLREKQLKENEASFDRKVESIHKEEEKKLRQEFFGMYNPGTKVWFYNISQVESKCPICNGKEKIRQKIVGQDGIEHTATIKCPFCNYGKVTTDYKYDIYEGEISQVRLILEADKDSIIKLCDDYYEKRFSYVEITYGGVRRCKTIYEDFDNMIFFNKEECEKSARAEINTLRLNLKKDQRNEKV